MLYPRTLITLLIFCLISSLAPAQEISLADFDLKPTNLPCKGWYKTLLLRDGRTFVMNIAPWEKMTVTIFDSAHNQTVSIRQLFKVINEKALSETEFKGLYEIDGYPTLFMAQNVNNLYKLVRIVFHPVTGEIREEIIIDEQEQTPCHGIWVVKCDKSDEYAVLHLKKRNGLELEQQVLVSWWNEKHNRVQALKVPLPANSIRNSVCFLGMTHDSKTGTYIALGLETPSETKHLDDRLILAAGIRPGDTTFRTGLINFGTLPAFNFALVQYNPFSNAVEIAASAIYWKKYERFSLMDVDATFLAFVDAATMTTLGVRQIGKNPVEAGPRRPHVEQPVRMITNRHGITTLVSESIDLRFSTTNEQAEETLLGPLTFRKLNEQGEELYKDQISKQQSAANYLYGNELARRGQSKFLFRDYPTEAYDNQFPSFECMNAANVNYIFYNGYADHAGATQKVVNSFDDCETFCYRLRTDNVSDRSYLFGTPPDGTKRALLLESMDMHPSEKTFSAVVSVKRGKEKQLCIAWCKMK